VRLFDEFRLLILLSGGKRTLRQSHDQFRCGMPVIEEERSFFGENLKKILPPPPDSVQK